MPDRNRQTFWNRFGFWIMLFGLAAAMVYFFPAPSVRLAPAPTSTAPNPAPTPQAALKVPDNQALVAYVGDIPISTNAWRQAHLAAEVMLRLLAPPDSVLDESVVLDGYLEDRLIAEEAALTGFNLPEEMFQAGEDRVLAVASLTDADLETILAEVGLDRSDWREELRLSITAATYLEDVILADIRPGDRGRRRADWLADLKEKHPIRTLVKVQVVEGMRPGNTPPDFALPLLDGDTVYLSDLRGRPVLLNFWATWCLPCREEMPLFEEVYRATRDDDFVLLAVDVGEDAESVRAFIDELGLTFPVALDRDQTVTQKYRIVGLPTSFYIDRDGVIQDLLIGAVFDMPDLLRRLEGIGVAGGG